MREGTMIMKKIYFFLRKAVTLEVQANIEVIGVVVTDASYLLSGPPNKPIIDNFYSQSSNFAYIKRIVFL